MGDTPAERAAALAKALDNLKGQPQTTVDAAMKYMMTGPSQPTADSLWRWVVKGLLVLLGVALVGLIVLIGMGKDVQVMVTVFSALLTGTIGLFVPSPVGKG